MPCGVDEIFDMSPSVNDQLYSCSEWSMQTNEDANFDPESYAIVDFERQEEENNLTGGCVSLCSSNEVPDRRGGSTKGKSVSDTTNSVNREGFFCSDYYSYSLRRSTKRLTMLGTPKFRQKEERKRVIKISQNKLKKIDDPEACLYRSVLINNTVKRLQNEAKEEKLNKQKNNVRSCRNYSCQNSSFEGDSYDPALSLTTKDNVESEMCTDTSHATKRKLDDCEVSHVLSQVYMPPTPRMITSIDTDEEDLIVPSYPYSKRSKLDNVNEKATSFSGECDYNSKTSSEEQNSELRLDKRHEVNYSSCDTQYKTSHSQCAHETSDSQSVQFALSQLEDMYYMPDRKSVLSETEKQYSCGQASMFGELQTVVFHSLIASLES